MWRLTLALLLLASSAFAQQQSTAYEALKLVNRQLGRGALSRVISVTGVDGDPQPTRWNILVVDRNAPGGVREIQVAYGRIVGSGPPRQAVVGSTSDATVPTSKLNLDSSGAFRVASYTADKSHVNFSYASYALRTNERGFPVWVVTLQDDNRRPLGTIIINANKGNVTRVEGLYRGANMAHVEQDPGGQQPVQRAPERRRRADDDQYADRGREVESGRSEDEYVESNDEGIEEGEEDENVVKAEIKRMFRRTKQDAARMFQRVRSSFDDFLRRG
ncbi:MAG TPA: hypothetical protein VF551_07530 [Chthoniobacterales bacterium]